MNNQETVKLTRLVKAVCPQQAMDEYTADAWCELLADLRMEDCTEAVKALGQTQPFIAPSEVRAQVRKIRAERIERTELPAPHPDLTPLETIEWLRETRKAIADGTYTPPEAGELVQRDMRFIDQIADQKAIEA